MTVDMFSFAEVLLMPKLWWEIARTNLKPVVQLGEAKKQATFTYFVFNEQNKQNIWEASDFLAAEKYVQF